MGVAERLAACIDDPRAQAQVVHGIAEMIRFRMLMIASGYEDGDDATAMRSDLARSLCSREAGLAAKVAGAVPLPRAMRR